MSDDKRRVSDRVLDKVIACRSVTTVDNLNLALDLRDERKAHSACRAALADAIKHADDFGAEADRLRGEKKTRMLVSGHRLPTANALDRLTPRQYRVISGEVGKQTEKLVDKYAALRDAVRWRCDEAGGAGYVVRVAELLALLKDDEGGAYRRGRDIPTAEAKAVAGGDSQEPPPPVTAAPSSDYCTGCGGTGRRPVFHHCPTCNGTGSLAEGTRDQMGCAKCNGTGKANESEG